MIHGEQSRTCQMASISGVTEISPSPALPETAAELGEMLRSYGRCVMTIVSEPILIQPVVGSPSPR